MAHFDAKSRSETNEAFVTAGGQSGVEAAPPSVSLVIGADADACQ